MTPHTLSRKQRPTDLAALGGSALFNPPVSTSNLVKPDLERFLAYARLAHDGRPTGGSGPAVQLLEDRLAAFHQTRHCIAYANGFWALVQSVRLLALPGRREVVMPSLTYRRLADIVAWCGLVPRFAEVDPATLAIGPREAAACITADTALILGVHPIVNCCDAVGLEQLSAATGIPLLFDAVESVYETVAGRKVGSFGRAECFSTHASKLINGFEGGYVTTDDSALAAQLTAAREACTGSTAADAAPLLGLDARLSEVHAAMALAGLDDLQPQVQRNLARYRCYQRALADLPGLRLLAFDEHERCSFKTIVVELTDSWPLSRADTLAVLNGEQILSRAYYAPPLHRKPARYATMPATLPLTDRLAERFMLMPCGHFVTDADIAAVAALLRFVHGHATDIQRQLHP